MNDDDFFSSLKGSKASKLQQLFVDDALSADDKEQSLKYQRPKDIADTSSSSSKTLIAKVVTAYKQGELQGKVGLALVQNVDICNIIIYKTKADILTTLKLDPEKAFLYKRNNYWQFYDETPTYWSFSFDKLSDEKDFVQQLDKKNITYEENEGNEHVKLNFSSFRPELHRIESEDIKNINFTKETKNSLFKRVAKVGKPLPSLTSNQQTTTECSDSSDTEVIQKPLPSISKPSITPRSSKLTTGKSNQQLISSIVDLSPVTSSVFPINPLESQYMQMLITEQRTQGSEIRMNINKLENKIEKVLDKLELFDRHDGKPEIEKDDKILELEEKLLMIKKENRKLKLNLQQNSAQQIKEILLQDILFDFEEDFKQLNIDYNQDLKNILFELCHKLKEHNNVLKEMEEKMKDNELKLEKSTLDLELNIKENSKLKNEISLLNQKENELRNKLNEKEAEALKQKHDFLDLQHKLVEKNQALPGNDNDVFIKSVMNNLFLDIVNKLDNGSFTHSEQILAIIATSIKQQTLECLHKIMRKDNFN